MILPAEIRAREFDARILQALLAVRQGWRAILGSKALINRNIWRFPRGVYLCQTLTKRRVSMLRLLHRFGVPSVGWCEEGLIYQSRDVYLERRVAPESLAELSALVAWGAQSRDDLATRSAEFDLQPLPLGNPRFDLLRLSSKGLYDDAVSDLEDRFGAFVLVNTNFSNVNWAKESAARSAPGGGSKGSESDTGAAAEYDAFREYRKELFTGFLEMIPRLAELLSDYRIVIRPHPAEDTAPWSEAARGHRNVVVEREGPVVPWILAAKAMIHNGCTTAVEAALLGRAPIAYGPVVKKELDAVLSNDISAVAGTVEELADLVVARASGDVALQADQIALLDHHVSSRQGPLATERILEVFEEVASAEDVDSASGNWNARAFAMIRHAYKAMRPGHQTDRYIPTVFPKTTVEEVEARCAVLSSCLGFEASDVRVRAIAQNVFEMSPA